MRESKPVIVFKYLLFVLQPWLAMILSWFSLKNKSSQNILILFAICYGIAFTIDLNATYDAVSYYKEFQYVSRDSFGEFISFLSDYFSGTSGRKDIYSNSVAFIVSRFTNNYHILFGVYAMIFSFFAIKSFNYLTELKHFKNRDVFSFLLAFIFLLSNPIFNINGVRFWTAAWIAIYLTLKIIIDDKKKFYLFLLLLPLVHGSYWVYIILFTIFRFVKNDKILIIILASSFFISEFTLSFVSNLGDTLPGLQRRYIDAYTSDEALRKVSERSLGSSNITLLLRFLARAFPNLLLFFLIKKGYKNKNWKINNLFKFTLILVSFSNMTAAIPSLGGRYLTLAFPLICILWLANYSIKKKYNWFIYFYPVTNLFGLFLFFNRTLEVLDSNFYIFPLPMFLFQILQ